MRRTALFLALFCFAWIGRAGTGVDLGEKVRAWLGSLDEHQRYTASYAFEDDERFDLRLAPLGLEGLRRDAMSADQWQRWREVLGAALSETGLAKVEGVMRLEREVRARDRERLIGRLFGGFVHGEDRYYVALFGEPVSGRPWGLRFEGHHLSLNWTVGADGALSFSPLFIGAEPREVPTNRDEAGGRDQAGGRDRAGVRVLAAEEDAGRALWHSLDAAERKRGELEFAFASGPGGGNRPLFVGAGERVEFFTPVGVRRASLDPAQQRLLDAIIETYLGNQPVEIAAAQRAAIAPWRDDIHFAWAGSLEPGVPGYYRLHGPNVLIEFDNTMESADHVHTIFRVFDGDFGRDLLAEHYAREHAPDALAHASGHAHGSATNDEREAAGGSR